MLVVLTLNDDIADNEKTDGICLPTFVANQDLHK